MKGCNDTKKVEAMAEAGGEFLIHSYSRAEALADGVLIDVSRTASEAGFRYPVAVTREVFDRYVTVSPEAEWNDESGRLWDLVWMTRYAIRQAKQPTDTVPVELRVQNTEGPPELVRLKAVCGPGDEGEPTIVIMMPHES